MSESTTKTTRGTPTLQSTPLKTNTEPLSGTVIPETPQPSQQRQENEYDEKLVFAPSETTPRTPPQARNSQRSDGTQKRQTAKQRNPKGETSNSDTNQPTKATHGRRPQRRHTIRNNHNNQRSTGGNHRNEHEWKKQGHQSSRNRKAHQCNTTMHTTTTKTRQQQTQSTYNKKH